MATVLTNALDFSTITSSLSDIKMPVNATLLAFSLLLLLMFPIWIHFREKHSKPALLSLGLFQNRRFTSLSFSIFLCWGSFNSLQFFLSLYYQQVQLQSALQTALRFLPQVITGFSANVVTGLVVHQCPAELLILLAATFTAASPLILAISLRPASPSYWAAGFPATSLCPLAPDVLFTIANLLIIRLFPVNTHALAGGVFNTLAQLGNSLGLAITAIISTAVTDGQPPQTSHVSALNTSYRAVFWACFAFDIAVILVCGFGLGRLGRVGAKG